jgi:hypothetical protein
MGTKLSVRTSEALHGALKRRAKSDGKTLSEFVRGILEEAVAERPVAERAAHVKGRLALPEPTVQWRQRLKDRNWRPLRRLQDRVGKVVPEGVSLAEELIQDRRDEVRRSRRVSQTRLQN